MRSWSFKHACIHMHIHTKNTSIHTGMQTYIRRYTDSYIHTCVHGFRKTQTSDINTYIPEHTQKIYKYIHR